MRWTRRTNSPNLPRLSMRLFTHGESLVQSAGGAEGAAQPTMGGHPDQTDVQVPMLHLSSDNTIYTISITPILWPNGTRLVRHSTSPLGLTAPIFIRHVDFPILWPNDTRLVRYSISYNLWLACMVGAISRRRQGHAGGGRRGLGNETLVARQIVLL